MTKAISILTAFLVFLIAVFSFVLSYSALIDVAIKNGITGYLAYIWPLLIDLSLVIFSLSVVNAYLQAENTTKQWCLVGIYTIATIAFNVLHAPDNWQSRIVAAIAPISLFFSFELLMNQLKLTIAKQQIMLSIKAMSQQAHQMDQEMSQKGQELTDLNNELDQIVSQIYELKWTKKQLKKANDTANEPQFIPGDLEALNQANEARQAEMNQRRELVLSLLEAGRSKAEIASELNVSLSTVKRDLVALNGQVTK